MKVLNIQEDHEKQVLVGQANPTKEFKVSNNAALMKVLSTALYQNPLKSMIREIMFNAWDAHNMGGCQDKPIEVTLGKDTGLIIRDFGPGIHADMIHPIYCVYGDSTKVEIQEETGGFGLGTKSPFSYTESFTVTSYHGAIKDIYLVSKTSENGDGKPGITMMASVPLDDPEVTGLMVSVPMKLESDVYEAKRYINSVCYLSGMKVKFTCDDNTKLIEAASVKPGEMILTNESSHSDDIYAVYGGVKYPIVSDDFYIDEYNAVELFVDTNNSTLFLGFAPDTLTPLPSREGINLSNQSKKEIHKILKFIADRLQKNIKEIDSLFIETIFKHMVSNKIPPQFALAILLKCFNTWTMKTELRNLGFDFDEFINLLKSVKPNNIVWNMVVSSFKRKFHLDKNMFDADYSLNKIFLSFCNYYPENRSLIFKIKSEVNARSYDSHNHYISALSTIMTRKCADALHPFELQMKKEFPDNKTLWPKIRLSYKSGWLTTERIIPFKSSVYSVKKDDNYKTMKTFSSKIAKEDPLLMYNKMAEREVRRLFFQKTVCIAKSVAQLAYAKRTYSNIFSPDEKLSSSFSSSQSSGMKGKLPYYVVPKTKGGYNRAKEILGDMGFKVIEVPDIPEEDKVRTIGRVPSTKYDLNLVNTYSHWWVDEDISPISAQQADLYLYFKRSELEVWGGSNTTTLIQKGIVKLVKKRVPNTVICHYMNQVRKVKKEGVPEFATYLEEWFKDVSKNKIRFRNLTRISKLITDRLEEDRLKFFKRREIWAILGVKVPDDQRKEFWFDAQLLTYLFHSHYLKRNHRPLYEKIDKTFKQAVYADPKKNINLKYRLNLQTFRLDHIHSKLKELPTKTEKIRFMRSFSRFLKSL